MPFHDELIDVRGVGGVEGLQGEVVDDQQVDPQQLADLSVVAVVEAAGPKSSKHPVAALEVHAVAAGGPPRPRAVARKVLPTPLGTATDCNISDGFSRARCG